MIALKVLQTYESFRLLQRDTQSILLAGAEGAASTIDLTESVQ